MDCPPIPQFCLNYLLSSKTDLEEHPFSASVVNRDFPRSSKIGLHALQGTNYVAAKVNGLH